jgi:peptide/nickel transport system permease protein
VVTAAGLDIGVLLGGVILTETVFNIPGIGRLAYDSIINADLPMIQGTVLVGAFFIVIANLLVDILYAVIDPRVRYS